MPSPSIGRTYPPKAVFEAKVKEILMEARERLERRKSLPIGEVKREIDYFIEPKDDEVD